MLAPWIIVPKTLNEAKLISAARYANDMKPRWVIDKVVERADAHAEKNVIWCELTIKPDVDNIKNDRIYKFLTS